MSLKKKEIRANFRRGVFERDRYRCKICGFCSTPAKAEEELDAHHIIDRHEFKDGGGYLKQNGITLCKGGRESCHFKAEMGEISADELFRRIGCSRNLLLPLLRT